MATPRMDNSIAQKLYLDWTYQRVINGMSPKKELCQGCLTGGIVGTGYALGCNKFDDWDRNRRKLQNEEHDWGSEPTKFESDLEKESEQKSKKDFATKFKDFDPRMVRGQIRDLQKQARKMDPEYRPDERGYGALMEACRGPSRRWRCHIQVKQGEIRRLRKAWEWLLHYQQEDVREMVRDKMGVYGITCPKTGNPFVDDADDEDYLKDYGDD
ncbi:MAG: hypothetical protein Q9185_003610 [Variospora sp. 1 TL-2023]